jgi:hypothetical protein
MSWKAHIVDDPMTDPLATTVRLVLVKRDVYGTGHYSYVTDTTLRMETVEEGARPEGEHGILLFPEMVPAILEGIRHWQGKENHAATEVAVLREWLAAEKARVDRALDKVG